MWSRGGAILQQVRKHGGNLKEASELYQIPEEKLLDFSANINPLGPPPEVYEIIISNIKKISQYPDSRNIELKNNLAKHLDLSLNNLVMGNGASELIFLIINHLRPQNVWIPVPTFSEYEIATASIGANVLHLPLEGENLATFKLDKLKDLKKGDLMFICNPNNPTGQLYSTNLLTEVYRLTREKGAYLVIDESFLDFIEKSDQISYRKKVNDNPNLIILYSLTKFFAIPGLRLGAAISHPELTSQFEKIRDPWNINVFAQLAGIVALNNREYIKNTLGFFREEKHFLYNKLKEVKGITPFKPSANFILIKLSESNSSSQVCRALAREGILVRNCNTYPLLGEHYIRIAIKNRKDNLQLIEKLKAVIR
jgi:threonine-phosphate decarboxylase